MRLLSLVFLLHATHAWSNQEENFQQSNHPVVKQSTNDAYSGIDQNGHFFRGNKKTGFYYNYGTGITCYGTHQKRTCYNSKMRKTN